MQSTGKLDIEAIQNVLSYCDLAVCQRMPYVSKKCLEAVEEKEEIPCCRIKEMYDMNQYRQIGKAFDVFTGARSATLYMDFLTRYDEYGGMEIMYSEKYEKMESVHMIGLPENTDFMYTLVDQITEITTPLFYYDAFDVASYPNCKKLSLDFQSEAFDFKSVFYHLYEPLDVLRIKNFGDISMLVSILGKGLVAKNIYVYVDYATSEDIEALNKLNQLKNCRIVVGDQHVETSGNDVEEYSDDECAFFNDDFIYFDESSELCEEETSESYELEVFNMFGTRKVFDVNTYSPNGSESFEAVFQYDKYDAIQSSSEAEYDDVPYLRNSQPSPKYWPAKVSIDC